MVNKKLRQLILVSQFAIILAIMAQVNIPLGPIPFTGQTFAVALIATILSPKQAVQTVAFYLLLGLIGLPVFTGGNAGLHALLGPTGGFLIGFLLQVLVTSWLLEKWGHVFTLAIISNILGAVLTLLTGTAWLKISNDLSWLVAFQAGFLPFIVQEIIKCGLASIGGLAIYRILRRTSYFSSLYERNNKK